MLDKMVAISIFIEIFPDTIAGKWRGVILRFSASKTSGLNSTLSCTKNKNLTEVHCFSCLYYDYSIALFVCINI